MEQTDHQVSPVPVDLDELGREISRDTFTDLDTTRLVIASALRTIRSRLLAGRDVRIGRLGTLHPGEHYLIDEDPCTGTRVVIRCHVARFSPGAHLLEERVTT